MRKVKNFARFYALLKTLPGDQEDIKETLVWLYTKERTKSLREMYTNEYIAMCDSLDKTPKSKVAQVATSELKKKRSSVLLQLQKLGVDTTDWTKIDDFCLNSRIAGKRFYNLTVGDLNAMVPKLWAMANKPKFIPKEEVPEVLITDSQIQNLINSMPKNQMLN